MFTFVVDEVKRMKEINYKYENDVTKSRLIYGIIPISYLRGLIGLMTLFGFIAFISGNNLLSLICIVLGFLPYLRVYKATLSTSIVYLMLHIPVGYVLFIFLSLLIGRFFNSDILEYTTTVNYIAYISSILTFCYLIIAWIGTREIIVNINSHFTNKRQ